MHQSDSSDDLISVYIQTLDARLKVDIHRGGTVLELKEKICNILGVSPQKQRLIFRGKVLSINTEKLRNIKVDAGSVVHVTVRKDSVENEENKKNEDNIDNTDNLDNNIDDGNNVNNTLNSPGSQINTNTIIPFISFSRDFRRLKRKNMHFDPSDCLEHLYQNIISINSLLNCRAQFSLTQFLNNHTIIPFNLSNRKFEVGQWIDVKDTTDKWLEGQIIKIRDKSYLNKPSRDFLIHFPGWGDHWDEWIPENSQRLALFRTFTRQPEGTGFLSPTPGLVFEAPREGRRPNDVLFFFEKLGGVIEEMRKAFKKIKMKRIVYSDNMSINNDDKDYYKESFKDIKEYKDNKDNKDNKEKENDKEINKDKNINVSNSYSKSNSNKYHNMNLNLNNLFPFSYNELEALQETAQLIPILDRCGRLMSDLSYFLSHVILNPNLYPNIILGHSTETSDSMSCTSGYSMMTNESTSILSGFSGRLRFRSDNAQNIVNNLRPKPQTKNLSKNVSKNTTKNAHTSQFQRPHYILNCSNSELPFVQKLSLNNKQHQNYYNNGNNNNPFDSFPKINLQIPPLISHNENTTFDDDNLSENNGNNNNGNVFLMNNIRFEQNLNVINTNQTNDSNSKSNNIISQNVNTSNNVRYNNYRFPMLRQKKIKKKHSCISTKDKLMKDLNKNIVIAENEYDINESSNNIENIYGFSNMNYISRSVKGRENSINSFRSNKTITSTKSDDFRIKYREKSNCYMKEQRELRQNLNKNNDYYECLSTKSDKNNNIKHKNMSYKSVSEVNEFGDEEEGEYENDNDNDNEGDMTDELNSKKDNITFTTSRKSIESATLTNEYIEDDNHLNNIDNNSTTNYNK